MVASWLGCDGVGCNIPAWLIFQILRSTGKNGVIRFEKGVYIYDRASFGIGLAALIVYLAAYYFLAVGAYDVLGWESADVRRLLGEVPLLLVYSAFFSLLTRAFVLLGMNEFFASNRSLNECLECTLEKHTAMY